ncbi:hypothetical protein KORDIASMS9_00328 [Kordia sp. SMS9]|nr:hypothetical protein KORDIASMS9_00328 [Kordia sp. SMS9]
MLLLVTVLAVSCTNFGEMKTFNGTEVYYKDGITDAQVEKLGKSLIESEFATGETKSVQFIKEGNTYVFKMVIKDEFLNDASLEKSFQYMPRELSNYMELPVDFHVCDNQFNTLRVYKLKDATKSIMAKATEIRYTKKVMKEDAEKLRDFLIEYGFSDNTNEKTVELDRENMTYIFKLVLNKRSVENQTILSYLTLLKNKLSTDVFSRLPVKIHACDEFMNTFKEI